MSIDLIVKGRFESIPFFYYVVRFSGHSSHPYKLPAGYYELHASTETDCRARRILDKSSSAYTGLNPYQHQFSRHEHKARVCFCGSKSLLLCGATGCLFNPKHRSMIRICRRFCRTRFGSWCYSGTVQLTPTLSLADIPHVIPALRMQQTKLDFMCDVAQVRPPFCVTERHRECCRC